MADATSAAWPPSRDDLLLVQKALLDLNKYAVGIRDGWRDPSDEAAFRTADDDFLRADYKLRNWLRAASSGESRGGSDG